MERGARRRRGWRGPLRARDARHRSGRSGRRPASGPGLRGRDSPSRSRNRRRGPTRSSGRCLASRAEPSSIAVPAEDAGLAHPRAVAHRLQRGEARASSRAAASRRASARRRGSGTSTGSPPRPNALPTCFSRLAAPSSLAPAQTSVPPSLEQRPAARDVGEVLLLVLGQQHQAERHRRRSRCAGRPTSRSASGGDTRAGTTARRRCP